MPKLKTKSGAKSASRSPAWQGGLCPARQAPRHDQADQEADPNLRGTSVMFKTDGDNVKKYFPAQRLKLEVPTFQGVL